MRLIRLIWGDILFQFRYGFYFLYGIFTAVYLFLLLLFPEAWREKAAAIIIFSDPAALGLFFMGAILLLEKSQQVLNALAVSPVRPREYVGAKLLSLALVSVLVSWVIARTAGLAHYPVVLVTTGLTSMIFTSLGLMAATWINSLNQYLIVTIPLEIICLIPPVLYLFMPVKMLRWYPLCGAIALLSGDLSRIGYDLLGLAAMALAGLLLANRSTRILWRSVGGMKG